MKKQKSVIIGIYKITSPSNRVYIGQSMNINKRWTKYKHFARQPKLYRSFDKYGMENHIFEIIEECEQEKLNERELYYKQIELDKVDNDWSRVLFCDLHDLGSGGPRSEETKQKISDGLKGRIYRDEWRVKIGISKLGNKNHLGFKHSEEAKDKIRKKKLGVSRPYRYKVVLQHDKQGNFIQEWESLKAATLYYKLSSGDISAVCRGKQKTAGGFKWEYKNKL